MMLLVLLAALADLQTPSEAHRVDVHLAARLWATAHKQNLIVVGGGAVDPALANGELERLAQAAGLKAARAGIFHVLAPPDLVASLPRRIAYSGGRRINVDFLRADAEKLMQLLADLDGKKIESQLSGVLSIRAVDAPVRDLAGWVAALAGAPLAVHPRKLAIGAAVLPAPATPPTQFCHQPPGVRLGCVANDKLRLDGVALGWALVSGDGAYSDLVRVGDRLGASRVVVRAIEPDHLELDGGARLSL